MPAKNAITLGPIAAHDKIPPIQKKSRKDFSVRLLFFLEIGALAFLGEANKAQNSSHDDVENPR